MGYTPELNFVTEFNISRYGMIQEMKSELNIIRLVITQIEKLGPDYNDMLERIVVMPLRKLLFENQHKPITLELCSSFKMPPTSGYHYQGDDMLHVELAPYKFGNISTWIEIGDWGNQKIAYYEKSVLDLPEAIPALNFCGILNKLKKGEKPPFQNYFYNKDIVYKGEKLNVYIRKKPEESGDNEAIFGLMKKAGYYDLTVYEFIKHISDKRGAHVDPGIAPLVKIINCNEHHIFTPIIWFGLQLIYAAKKQIPEMADYWPEMDSIVENS